VLISVYYFISLFEDCQCDSAYGNHRSKVVGKKSMPGKANNNHNNKHKWQHAKLLISWWNCSFYLFIWHLKKQQAYTQVYIHRVISFQLITIHYSIKALYYSYMYNDKMRVNIVTWKKGSSSEYTTWEFCQRWNHIKIHHLKRWFKISLPCL